jgi:osmotically inducible protein OsmC
MIRKAEAEWQGTLTEGKGHLTLGSGAFAGEYSFASRFGDDGAATNPEELIGAAHAGCFTMALGAALTKAGLTPKHLHTVASVRLEKVNEAFEITKITLELTGEAEGVDAAKFAEFAEGAKKNCPVSKALAGTSIELVIK